MHARMQAAPLRTRSCATARWTRHQALPDRTAASVAQGSDTAVEQHTDHSNDQAKLIQKLRREAYEAGYKAGYQQGVQVSVSVSVDLDDDSGSYLRRQPGARNGSNGNGSSSSGSNGKQPWLPQSRAGQGSAQAAPGQAAAAAVQSTSSSSSQASDSIARSAVKGLVWRIFSTTATVGVAMIILKDSLEVSDALKFGGIEFATKYVMYFLHERLWAAVALL